VLVLDFRVAAVFDVYVVLAHMHPRRNRSSKVQIPVIRDQILERFQLFLLLHRSVLNGGYPPDHFCLKCESME